MLDAVNSLSAALKAYDLSRTDTGALRAARDTASRLSDYADVANSRLLQALLADIRRLSDRFLAGPKDDVQALVDLLRNISANVVNVEPWTVRLNNGTRVSVVSLVDRLWQEAQDYLSIAAAATPSGGRRLLANDTSVAGGLLQSFEDTKATLSTLVSSILAFNSRLTPTVAAVASGPDPSDATTYVNSTLRSSLDALTSPLESLSQALTAYNDNPGPDTWANVRTAASAAQTRVTDARSTLDSFMPDGPALVDTATRLNNSLAQLSPMLASLGGQVAAFQPTLTDLVGVQLPRYQQGVSTYLSLVQALPPDVARTVSNEASNIAGDIQDIVQDVTQQARSAASTLDDTVDRINDDVLRRGRDLQADHKNDSLHYAHVAYGVWMGCWGLAILLVLVLLGAVVLNWPGGLVTAGLLLMVLLVASQVLCVVLAGAMALLKDGCEHVEAAVMRRVVQDSDPEAVVLLSYYLFHYPDSQELALQLATGLNVTDVMFKITNINATLEEKVTKEFQISGPTEVLLNGILRLVDWTYNSFLDVLELLTYARVNPLYTDSKAVACCKAAQFAYNEWCATTAYAALVFGALVAAAYLLSRMDTLPRRGCCGCCACTLLSYDREGLLDQVEDKAAAAAADAWRRQQEQQQQNQLQQQALLPPAPHAMTSEQQQQQVPPAPYPGIATGTNGQPLYAAPPMTNGGPHGAAATPGDGGVAERKALYPDIPKNV